jgi:serine phosphatase RsbU (regulator of sigma subunit)
LIVMLVGSALAALGTHAVVRDQEQRLLRERAAEVNLVFTAIIAGVENSFNAELAVLRAAGTSPATFASSVAAAGNPATSTASVALVHERPDHRFEVVRAAGSFLHTGQILDGARATALAQALADQKLRMAATTVIGSGEQRSLGFAKAAPGLSGVPQPLLLYRESRLGRLGAGSHTSNNAAFHEVEVALYAAAKPDPAQLLITTASTPSGSDDQVVHVAAGSSTWLLSVGSKSPLVGSIASKAWWVVLLAGCAAAALLAAVTESSIRRRDLALSLAAVEQKQAEMLQRSLLPQLPQLPGLKLAARYRAGGAGQQVGGDWFDVFALPDGAVGFVIGDVMGHDPQAAAAMSEIRSVLRAYAYGGDSPETVLRRLNRYVGAFAVTPLVSVVYGVLSAPDLSGDRLLRYVNAGHVPPLLQRPDGSVTELDETGLDETGLGEAENLVLGVADDASFSAAELEVSTGTTLLLFTDGLVEAPHVSLTSSMAEVAQTFAAHSPSEDPDQLCEHVLQLSEERGGQDDVALLVVQVNGVHTQGPDVTPASSGARRG